MENSRYRRFQRHADNVNEPISATSINDLQEQSEINQQRLFSHADTNFINRALFYLEHHVEMNSMFADPVRDLYFVNMDTSTDIQFNKEESSISMREGVVESVLFTKVFQNINSTVIKEILFMSDTVIPPGTNIIWDVSNNNIDWYRIEDNGNVFSVPTTGTDIYLRARFVRPLGYPSPVLKGYAVLYRDLKYALDSLGELPPDGTGNPVMVVRHSDLYGIGPDDHHPQEHSHDGNDGSGRVKHSDLIEVGPDDHHPKEHKHGEDGVSPVNLDTDVVGTLKLEHLPYIFFTGVDGGTIIYYNSLAEDKAVKVESPEDETYLFYDWNHDGRLEKTITIRGDIAIVETFVYGDYLNSRNETETRFLGSNKEPAVDATNAAVQAAIAAAFAPKP